MNFTEHDRSRWRKRYVERYTFAHVRRHYPFLLHDWRSIADDVESEFLVEVWEADDEPHLPAVCQRVVQRVTRRRFNLESESKKSWVPRHLSVDRVYGSDRSEEYTIEHVPQLQQYLLVDIDDVLPPEDAADFLTPEQIADLLGLDKLNGREQKILPLLGQGMTYEDIADEIGYDGDWPRAYVAQVVKRLRRKLGVEGEVTSPWFRGTLHGEAKRAKQEARMS